MIAIIILLLFGGATVITHILLIIGIIIIRSTEKKRIKRASDFAEASLTISLIVPARDEEQNLPRLFASLEKQTRRDWEIVFVNDRSVDATGRILGEFASRYPSRVTIVTLTEKDVHPELNPKQNALTRGIAASRGEILLLTDADCSPPDGWVDAMAAHFIDPAIGLVIGPIHTRPSRGFLSAFQIFDHIFRYFYTVATIGLGMPTGGFGNNLAIRRSALEEIGGYQEIGYSVTEDAALIAALNEHGNSAITAVSGKEHLMLTSPQDSWKRLSGQEKRWSAGAFFSKDPATVFGYALVMIFLLGGVVCVPLSFFYTPAVIVVSTTAVSMLMIAVAGGIILRKSFISYWLTLLPSIIWAGLFYTFNNFLSLFRRSVVWKGQKLDA